MLTDFLNGSNGKPQITKDNFAQVSERVSAELYLALSCSSCSHDYTRMMMCILLSCMWQLAEQYSDCSSHRNGGDLGEFGQGREYE